MQAAAARIVEAPDDRIREADYRRLSEILTGHTGIRLPAVKRTMLEGRLRKRMRATGHATLRDYLAFLLDGNGLAAEMTHVIDVVTTNKTDFFREPQHFRFLAETIVPDSLARQRNRGHLKIWSAAASNGAEAYTIAMVLAELARHPQTGFEFAILGTDISTDILAEARRAVYPEAFVGPVPAAMAGRYLMNSRDRAAAEVRIVPELRRCVRFQHLNLMDADYPVDGGFDAIFLRNVLIYFDKETQIAVVRRLLRHLRPEGFLLLGHAETMIGAALQLRQLAPAVFRID